MKSLMPIFGLFLFLSLLPISLSAKMISGKVLSIHDGDTLTFLPEGTFKKAKVRFMGVDTPEIDFNGSTQGEVALLARDFLMSILPIDATIQVELSDKDMDTNGRYLGKILYRGRDLNLEILKAGWGATYFIYPYDKKMVIQYQQASQEASAKMLGAFSFKYRSQPVAYIFRQQSKGLPGNNLVADFETKKIYNAEETELVPHFRRVFFSSEEIALQHGFTW